MTEVPAVPRLGRRRALAGDLGAALVGVAVFLFFCDARILQPRSVGWMLDRSDPAQHYLSWQFFRDTPLLQFPLGLNPRFGTDLESSIVFSDSIPLLAVPFKYARTLLPRPFQYHGLWLLGCFVLQAIAARRLLARFELEAPAQLLGAALCTLSPPLLWRLHGHYSLVAHWLVVAGIGLYFSERYRRGAWLALLGVAVLVHAYLLAAVAAVWFADLIGRRREKAATTRAALLDLALGLGSVAALAYAVGYFVVGESVAIGGFGFFRMNLLSPFVPFDDWSRLLPSLPHSAGEYEGFNFLGAGTLALGLTLIVVGPFGRRPVAPPLPRRTLAPLVWVAVLLTIYALSNQVYFGRTEVLSYGLAPAVQRVAETFRASGRMFWPVFYLLMLTVLVGTARRFSPRVAVTLLCSALVLQTYDSAPAAARFRRDLRAGLEWRTPLVSRFWNRAAERYDKMLIVPPSNDHKGIIPLAHFAGLNGLTINSGYYSRFDGLRLRAAVRRAERLVELGRIDPRGLYIFRRRDGVWEQLRETRPATDFVGVIDGYAVFAPGLAGVYPEWQEERSREWRRRRSRAH